MKNLFVILSALGLVLLGLTAPNVMAAEKVMEQDTVTTVTEQTNLVKTADNFIILFDSSSSMNEPYLNTGMSKLEAAKEILKEKNKKNTIKIRKNTFNLHNPYETYNSLL